jgi:hypothetical protein
LVGSLAAGVVGKIGIATVIDVSRSAGPAFGNVA